MSEIVDKAKALVSTYEQLLERTRAERDQLRADLTAAKNLLARIHRDGGHHTEAVGFAQSVADAGDKVSEWLLVAEERNALAAHVERLEKGLREIADGAEEDISALTGVAGQTVCKLCGNVPHDEKCSHTIATSALAATPAQSLAAHDAAVKVAVLREAAKRFAYRRNDGDWTIHPDSLAAEADRIEKEAKNGEENDRQT